jgi:hypothetical protein
MPRHAHAAPGAGLRVTLQSPHEPSAAELVATVCSGQPGSVAPYWEMMIRTFEPRPMTPDLAPRPLRVRWWIAPSPRADARATCDIVSTAIANGPAANDSELPSPASQILVHAGSEDADGDRTSQPEGRPAVPPKGSDA